MAKLPDREFAAGEILSALRQQVFNGVFIGNRNLDVDKLVEEDLSHLSQLLIFEGFEHLEKKGFVEGSFKSGYPIELTDDGIFVL